MGRCTGSMSLPTAGQAHVNIPYVVVIYFRLPGAMPRYAEFLRMACGIG